MKKMLLVIAAAAAVFSMETLADAPKTFKDCPDCPEMIMIPAGSFQMGSQRAAADGAAIVPWEFEELPRHLVHVKPFQLHEGEKRQKKKQNTPQLEDLIFDLLGADAHVLGDAGELVFVYAFQVLVLRDL